MKIDCSNIKGFIFDIDGTILDSMPIWDSLSERYLETKGIVPEKNLSRTLSSMSIKEGASYIKEHHDINLSNDEIYNGIINYLQRFYYEQVQAKAGAEKLLKEIHLQGIPIVLATTGDFDLAFHALQRLNLLCYINKIFSCNEFNTNKESPFIFYKAAQSMEQKTAINPKEFIVVEDSLVAIQTAKKEGFITVAIQDDSAKANHARLKQISDYYAENFYEIELNNSKN